MLDVIIVNWNSNENVQQLLNRLNETKYDGKIIIVDNNSEPESLFKLELFINSVDLNVFLTKSDHNRGFAGGCNLGASQSNAEYLLFLNPDIIIDSDSIKKTLQYMQNAKDENVGVLGIQLLNENGIISRTSARFPLPQMFLARNLGLDKIWPHLGHPMIEWDHQSTLDVDQVIGAYFLTPRRLFDQLNGFDERFFVYFEEVDYAFRASRLGYKSRYLSTITAYHEGGGSTNQVRGKRLFYSLRSRLLYGKKHYDVQSNALNIFNTVIIEPISRIANSLISNKGSDMKDIIEAFTLLYKNLPTILKTRMK